MDQFLQELPIFGYWTGIIIGSILLNLVSTAIWKLMERNYSSLSLFFKHKVSERAEKTQKFVDLLHSSSDLRFLFAHRSSTYKMRSISFLFFSLIFLEFSLYHDFKGLELISTFFIIASGVTLFIAHLASEAAMRIDRALYTAIVGEAPLGETLRSL